MHPGVVNLERDATPRSRSANRFADAPTTCRWVVTPGWLSVAGCNRCADTSLNPMPVSQSAALKAEFPLPHPSPSAIFKELDEGGVLLSTSDEVYFGVNPVGARIWSLLPPVSRTFGELCAALEQQYPDAGSERIRVDVQEFLEALIASGLVITATN